MQKGMTTAGARLDSVRRATGCENKAEFARWIGAKSSQAVDAWAARNKITPDGAQKIARATGASTHWLQFGEGEPFPNGVTPFPGTATGDARLAQIEAHLDALSAAQAQIARVVSESVPGARQALLEALGGLVDEGRSLLPELAVVLRAVEAAGQSKAPAGQRDARHGSDAKPPRKGR